MLFCDEHSPGGVPNPLPGLGEEQPGWLVDLQILPRLPRRPHLLARTAEAAEEADRGCQARLSLCLQQSYNRGQTCWVLYESWSAATDHQGLQELSELSFEEDFGFLRLAVGLMDPVTKPFDVPMCSGEKRAMRSCSMRPPDDTLLLGLEAARV